MFTLVPANFFDPSLERQALEEVAVLAADQEVRHIVISQYGAVLIYSVDDDSTNSYPIAYQVLTKLSECKEHYKILCHIGEREICIAVAEGNNLLLCNAYPATDFTTALYYIFLVMKSLQLNPEVSTIHFLSEIDSEQELKLYRYFKAVERI